MDDQAFLVAVEKINELLQEKKLLARLQLERAGQGWNMWIEKNGALTEDDVPLLTHSECRGALLGIGIGMRIRALE